MVALKQERHMVTLTWIARTGRSTAERLRMQDLPIKLQSLCRRRLAAVARDDSGGVVGQVWQIDGIHWVWSCDRLLEKRP